MCLRYNYSIVALKLAWGEARRGRIAAELSDRGATKPQANFSANPSGGRSFWRRLRCLLLTYRSDTPRRSRLAFAKNSWPRWYSYIGDTSLVDTVGPEAGI